MLPQYSGLVIVLLLVFTIVFSQDFGYEGNEGPNHWGAKYSKCLGKHQSPIDIEEDNILLVTYPPLVFENFNESFLVTELKNNGHTVTLTILEGKTPKLHGGPLNGTYKFSQLHFHWGANDTEGSENTIKHHRFAMELHMVFYKEEYGDFQSSLNMHDGLTVLSYLYSVHKKPNKNYESLTNALENIHEVETITTIKNFVPLEKFSLKNPQKYFTYEGSLTTPPCSEVVTWIEFLTTIPLSSNQTEMFRLLNTIQHTHLTHNYRPVQPLYDRVIYLNAAKNSAEDRHWSRIKRRYLLLSVFLIPLFL